MIMDPHQNIIQNPKFENGLNNWSGVGCKLVTLQEYSTADGKTIDPHHSKTFVVATGREESWNGVMQDITGRVDRHVLYEINAVVRVQNKCSNSNVMSRGADDNMQATLCLQLPDHRQRNITISLVEAAAEEEWIHVQGKFIISSIISPSRVTVTLHGPPPSADILIHSLVIKPAEKCHPSPPPIFTKHHANYGVNIIQNSDFTNNTNSWYPIGNSTLSIKTDQAKQLPQTSNYSQLIHHQNPDQDQPPSTGTRYMQVTNRSNSQDGVAQNIPVKNLQLFLTYQVSAYVKVVPTTTSGGGSGTKNLLSTTTQCVNATVTVDGRRLKGARVDVALSDGSNISQWCEIVCSFRIEKKKLPSKLGFQVQGPESGFDILIASGVAVFAVDRKSRFQLLKTQTDKVRKRDVILKFKEPAGSSSPKTLKGATVNIKQTKNNFPLGTCITRDNLDNKNLITFFLNNFNWSVFGNELKWYHTEPTRSNFNYRDADEMLDFCNKNNIQVRGHCIFWSVESMVQQWIRALSKDELKKAVEDHLTGLLNRYTSKFKHYDVNNEMLHGSFFQDHLGKEIRPYMFTKARELDHNAVLFVNDYNVENGGGDSKATPTKYVDQILGLRAQGVDLGGIGLQGHMDSPVGSVVASALDELWSSTNNTPIWFTELDVTSRNEHVRAEDLEVMLREAYAHPGVGGVVLWGFMEGTMWRQNAYLVNADGEVNEAGRKLIELKKEWTSNVNGGVIGDDNGVFEFKGFYGDYEVEVVFNDGNTVKKSVVKSFVVDKSGIVGNGHVDPLVISIDL